MGSPFTFLPIDPQNKKAELTFGAPFGSSAFFSLKRPAAFRPLLTKSMALSG